MKPWRVLDHAGRVAKQPWFWAGVAGLIDRHGGPTGRRAARRGATSYAAAAVVANLVVKPLVHRRRPEKAGPGPFKPLTSSFPSGHAAADTAFAVGVASELPGAWPALALLTTASHWSLVRTRSHYVSDVLAGDVLGVFAALAVLRLWKRR